MLYYDHKKIEAKWRKAWQKNAALYAAQDAGKKPHAYILDMFPYPSGDGLHVGHVEGYTASDIYSRYLRMSGKNVLHPMGWDAFGLPAENYAIKHKVHPAKVVAKNVENFRKQMDAIGFSYDWSREINTTDTGYYKWTQWIFLKLFEHGLAYEADAPINWCPKDKTGLANEEVVDGKCERCGTPVVKKKIRQWILKITRYADRLLSDLEGLDWPEKIIAMQRKWIGRSEGVEIDFIIEGSGEKLKVFTTRPDTLFGATYMVVAPEHPIISKLKSHIKNSAQVKAYTEAAAAKTEIERTAEGKEKMGVELKGIVAINPVNQEHIPVFAADYVLSTYGTGAIMAVPAHDRRDFEFAKKYNIHIVRVVDPITLRTAPEAVSGFGIAQGDLSVESECFEGTGTLVNSGKFSGMDSEKAKKAITEFVSGKTTVKYKLRDWIFSRQRYWGEPIPIIHCKICGAVPVPEKDLPVKLPNVKSYEPTGTGESPLASIEKWVNTKCPKCKGKAKRETNTMPQWAGSCWYYLRYLDPKNKKKLVDPKKEKKWMPVSLYIGGAEHAVLHLLYARFWHKFLFDIGAVSTKEPFKKLVNQGLILGPDGQKMSKSRGNVINPDEVVSLYGADTLRMYEMFMGPFEDNKAWDTKSIVGIRRFLERAYKLGTISKKQVKKTKDVGLQKHLHKTIKKVTEDIEHFRFNTAISSMMVLLNEFDKEEYVSRAACGTFTKLLAPFAPFLAEELWYALGNKGSVHKEMWSVYDKKLVQEDEYDLVVQVNGKVRDVVRVPKGILESEARGQAYACKRVKKFLEGKNIKRHIFVPDKILNIIIGE